MDAVDDVFTVHPFIENAGRRTFLTFFKKDRFLKLIIVNFGNAASHKYVVEKGKNLWRLVQKWLCIHLFLSKIYTNSVLKIPVALKSEWVQQGQYWSVSYNNDDVTTHNLLRWID